jgi:hypothetical protein
MLALARSFRWLIGAFHGAVERDGNCRSDAPIVNERVVLVAAVYDRRRFLVAGASPAIIDRRYRRKSRAPEPNDSRVVMSSKVETSLNF